MNGLFFEVVVLQAKFSTFKERFPAKAVETQIVGPGPEGFKVVPVGRIRVARGLAYSSQLKKRHTIF